MTDFIKTSLQTVCKELKNTMFIAAGGCGMNMLESWLKHLPTSVCSITVNRDAERMNQSTRIKHRILLDSISCVDRQGNLSKASRKDVQSATLSEMPELTKILKSRENVILLAGLGGSTGTWASQIIYNHLLSLGKQVVTVLVVPFAYERSRVRVAEEALPGFDGLAHRVLCYNDYLIRHSPEGMSMADAFEFMNEKAFELLGMPVAES